MHSCNMTVRRFFPNRVVSSSSKLVARIVDYGAAGGDLRYGRSKTESKLLRLLDLYEDLPHDSDQPFDRLAGLGRGHQLVTREE